MNNKRIAAIGICLAIAVTATSYGAPLIHLNLEAYSILATIMTVFAGFLFAVLSIIGDPSQLLDGDWKIAEANRNSVESRLIRLSYLFLIYCFGIAALVLGIFVKDSSLVCQSTKIWIDKSVVFLSVFSFLLTLGLPRLVFKMQIDRYDNEIERRRKNAGIDEGK